MTLLFAGRGHVEYGRSVTANGSIGISGKDVIELPE
jgi:hypothetical protein